MCEKQPDRCQLTLQHIGQAHGHQLSQLPIQDKHVLQRYVLVDRIIYSHLSQRAPYGHICFTMLSLLVASKSSALDLLSAHTLTTRRTCTQLLPPFSPSVCGCRSGLSEGASLADLVAVGLNDNEVATSVLVDLKAEVRTPTRPFLILYET